MPLGLGEVLVKDMADDRDAVFLASVHFAFTMAFHLSFAFTIALVAWIRRSHDVASTDRALLSAGALLSPRSFAVSFAMRRGPGGGVHAARDQLEPLLAHFGSIMGR